MLRSEVQTINSVVTFYLIIFQCLLAQPAKTNIRSFKKTRFNLVMAKTTQIYKWRKKRIW